MPIDPVAITIALSAGFWTFFSPCAVSLVPAYVGYFVGLEETAEDRRTPRAALFSGARFSGAAAAGILALFALGGAGLFLLRRWVDPGSTFVGDAIVWVGIAVGGLLVLLGIGMLRDGGLEVTVPVRAPEHKTPLSMAAFGVLFAAGSVGCSLPLAFNVVVQALAQGPVGALVTFLAYGVGLAGVMVAVGIGVSLAKEQVHAHIRRLTPYFRPVAGVILILGGLYTAWYYWAVLTI